MVSFCCVPLCQTTSKTPNVALHSFTKNVNLKERWIQNIRDREGRKNNPGLFKVTKHTKVCSLHFEKQYRRINSEKCRLRPEAIPTIFAWTKVNTTTTSTTGKSKESTNTARDDLTTPSSKPDAITRLGSVQTQNEDNQCTFSKESNVDGVKKIPIPYTAEHSIKEEPAEHSIKEEPLLNYQNMYIDLLEPDKVKSEFEFVDVGTAMLT